MPGHALLVPADFPGLWLQHHAGLAPLGYVLRQRLADRWLRLHALPGSRRYPQGLGDQAEILARAAAIGEALFGPQAAAMWMVEPLWYGARQRGAGPRWMAPEAPVPQDLTLAPQDAGYRVSCLPWNDAALGPAFLRVAEDQARFMLISADLHWMLAPHDGGFDIIAPDVAGVAALKSSFGRWLSDRPDGL